MNPKIEKMMEPHQPQYRGVQPVKFLVWLLIIASIMMFGALTSAIIVRSADGMWAEFPVPNQFYISTVLVILSSITMQLAYINAKKDNVKNIKWLTAFTFLLGIAFISFNYSGWLELARNNFALDTDVDGGQSASFFHISTYLHAAHVLVGLVFLAVTLFRTFQYKVHRKSMLLINISTTYWHFVDILWIYLFLFLILLR